MVVMTFRKFLFIQYVLLICLVGCGVDVDEPLNSDPLEDRQIRPEQERAGESAVEVIVTDQGREA